jgi:hypothetical protein
MGEVALAIQNGKNNNSVARASTAHSLGCSSSSTLLQLQDVVLASTWLSPHQIRLAISRLSARRYSDGFFQQADGWFRPLNRR